MSGARRIASVDALRGLAVAAMLLVNNPGDWGHVYAPLQHAGWHGCTPTDLIFPFFLFIVGVSAALALGPRVDAGSAPGPLQAAVVTRGLRIVALGLALHALAWWLLAKPEFRVMGVLQRIGLCFIVVGVAALRLRTRGRLLTLGLAAAVTGWVWSAWLPLNKQLWTPSFVLWTGGLAALALAGAHAWVDRRGHRPWGRAFGLNAIGAYAGAWLCTVLLAATGWMAPLYASVFGPVGTALGAHAQSLAFALAFVGVWALIVWALDRRGWYWKI